MAIIRAAGGLVWRAGRDGRQRLAVIHRPHREDWSLPKGKLKDGEHWEEAALREVFEETGCKARIVSFAGCVHYVPKRTPKVVLFWNMELVEEGPLAALDEVDKVAWLTRGEALKRLDHETEREVLVEALELRHFAPPPEAPPSPEPDAATPRPSVRGFVLATAAAVVVAALGAHWLGAAGAEAVATGAAALGGLACVGVAILSRPRRG